MLLLFLSACAQQDGQHPLYVKAQRKIQAGEYAAGEKLLLAYLKINPNSARAGKDLATLYDDQLNAPLMAVYYYRLYLTNAAPNAPDRETVKKWLETAEHKYYLHLKDEYNDPEDIKSLRYRLEIATDQLNKVKTQSAAAKEQSRQAAEQFQAQLTTLTNAVTQAKTDLQKMQHRQWEDAYFISKLKTQIADLKKSESSLIRENNELKLNQQEKEKFLAALEQELRERPPKNAKPGSPLDAGVAYKTGENGPVLPVPSLAEAVNGADVTPPSAQPDSPVVMPSGTQQSHKNPEPTFYKIQNGDTLIKISKQFYGSGKYYQRIIDANKSLLESPMALRPDMVIKIPPAEPGADHGSSGGQD